MVTLFDWLCVTAFDELHFSHGYVFAWLLCLRWWGGGVGGLVGWWGGGVVGWVGWWGGGVGWWGGGGGGGGVGWWWPGFEQVKLGFGELKLGRKPKLGESSNGLPPPHHPTTHHPTTPPTTQD